MQCSAMELHADVAFRALRAVHWGGAAFPMPTCLPGCPCQPVCRWVEAAGGRVTCSEGVEVSPLVSVAGEGLEAVVAGQEFASTYNVHLQAGSGGYSGGGGGAGKAARACG